MTGMVIFPDIITITVINLFSRPRVYGPIFPVIFSERRTRAGSSYGEWKAEEDPQAQDHLLQLPARGVAETLPEGAVPRPPGASRARGAARPDADTGEHRRRDGSA